jgi:DNA polymerase III delta prime subunit
MATTMATAPQLHQDFVYCHLKGFPKDFTAQELRTTYLPDWAVTSVSLHEIWMHHHQKSSSVVLKLPNHVLYKRLVLFVQQHNENENENETTTTTTHKKISIAVCDRPSSPIDHVDVDVDNDKDNDNGVPNTTNTRNPNKRTTTTKKRRKKKKPKPYDDLANQFLDYVHEQNSQICHRDVVSKLFSSFLLETTAPTSSCSPRRLESLVLARMRQLKLVKSKRLGYHHVGMTFCNADDPLSFPSRDVRQETQEFLLEQQRQAEHDKEGVSVSRLPDRLLASVGVPLTIAFDVVRVRSSLPDDDDDDDDDNDAPEVTLEEVELRGAQAHLFELVVGASAATLEALPLVLTPVTTTMAWTVTPKRIGLLRARAHFSFNGFFITRPITLSCGIRAEFHEVLQPKSPYRRPQRRHYFDHHHHEAVEGPAIGPPPQERGKNAGTNINPFAELAHYSIPTETVEFLESKEFDGVMDSLEWSPISEDTTTNTSSGVADYGQYWSHLLHASEYQSSLDIQLFDMEEAELIREGRYFLLTVPGLAEGRPSVLRGDLVHVTYQHQLYKGRVHSTRLEQVVLELPGKFTKSFHPSLDRANIRFTFSRMTYRTSHRACLELAETVLGDSMLAPMPHHVVEARRGVSTPTTTPTTSSSLKWANRQLNPEQQVAIQRMVDGTMRPLPYILFGPPGTGKTTTLVEAVYQLASQNKRILLMAPSNDAADILIQRLASYFPPSELRRLLAYSRSRDSLPAEIRDYASDDLLESDAQLVEVRAARIVVSTVNLAARISYWGVQRGHFDVICVDEAGHATEPEVVAVVASLMDPNPKTIQGQLILAGDPKQLGPITTSEVCQKYGLGVSYMERLTKRSVYERRDDNYPVDLLTKLVRNYRSHSSILRLPNEMFYDKELECCGDVMVTSNMVKWEHLPKPGFPVVFHAVHGENLREGNSPSWFNPQEAQQIVDYVDKLLNQTKPPLTEDEIGIITPYARQAQKIRAALAIQNVRTIKVGSVECFQGQERRVILLSTVRAEQEHVSQDVRYNLGFVAHPKRFNVAITRAKALLVVIGCPSILAMDKDNWLPFLKYCHENGSWAGEDWDPSEVQQEDDDEAGDEILKNSWEVVNAPSHAVEQEGFAFIHREE